jgi:hypothetical protein
MIKVKQEKFDESRPAPAPAPEVRSEEPVINITNNIDIEQITEAIRAMGKSDSPESIIFAIKETQADSNSKHAELIRYLSDKMDVLVEHLRERPTSFEFDVKRNNNGFISTVLVKPIK